MKNFAYYQPGSVEEALEFISGKIDYQLLAGGTDLLVRWKRGVQTPKEVVNIKGVRELNFLHVGTQSLEIGALIKVDDLQRNPHVQKHYPALALAAAQHSSPLIRNLATVVGNVCNASPAADLVPALLVYGAQVKVRSKSGERVIELQDFFVGPGKTLLNKGEMVTALIIPVQTEDTRSIFVKEGKRKAHEIAVVNCAVSLSMHDGHIANLRIALGAVGPKPILLADLDWYKELTRENEARLAQLIDETVSPITDQRSTDWYRREVVQIMVKRAIAAAMEGVN